MMNVIAVPMTEAPLGLARGVHNRTGLAARRGPCAEGDGPRAGELTILAAGGDCPLRLALARRSTRPIVPPGSKREDQFLSGDQEGLPRARMIQAGGAAGSLRIVQLTTTRSCSSPLARALESRWLLGDAARTRPRTRPCAPRDHGEVPTLVAVPLASNPRRRLLPDPRPVVGRTRLRLGSDPCWANSRRSGAGGSSPRNAGSAPGRGRRFTR